MLNTKSHYDRDKNIYGVTSPEHHASVRHNCRLQLVSGH